MSSYVVWVVVDRFKRSVTVIFYPESVMRIPRLNYPVPFFLSLSHDVRSRVGVRRFIGTVTDILRDENKLLDSTHMG
jgi:hypothetical protein